MAVETTEILEQAGRVGAAQCGRPYRDTPITAITLPRPPEPAKLRATTRRLLEEDPATGVARLEIGEWIARPLWKQWGPLLRPAGMRRARFRQIVVDYRHELRLWVMGERPWEHCVDGLAGRVTRRIGTR